MILISDDDVAVRSSLTLVLNRAGHETMTGSCPEETINCVRTQSPEAIIMDMNYSSGTGGEEGLTLLKQVKIFRPEVPVILITAWGSIHLAVRGIQSGAFDFITKPWDNRALLKSVETAISLNKEDETDNRKSIKFDKIIGKSPLLTNIFNTIAKIANTNAPVLITGESGTGKELIAEAIHRHSNRNKKPFVKVNLGGISQSLFESEMFGHKKGAFTDALYDRTGRFEMADKGTIFLDEIGEPDAGCQVKLLRVLQDQTFEILGDSKQKQVDVRIISATNRNLQEMVGNGTFREDLFYRINLITIHVPALRERLEDIPLLVKHFISLQAGKNGLSPVEISNGAIDFLKTLPYPGNIRELKNLVERTILVSGKPVITADDFEKMYQENPGRMSFLPENIRPLEEMEKNMILKAFKLYGNNYSKIATALGLTRQALYRRLEKYNIIINEK
ncbi:MAG: sigma-54 dependent transcriptional regulator [Dysgonamonadaceae bacterium]|jgi:DNA-binding NtrC family response regulator|nr:sigma-54 dependent transcriptional regulator [Dysgonamonadaceae bacterium]